MIYLFTNGNLATMRLCPLQRIVAKNNYEYIIRALYIYLQALLTLSKIDTTKTFAIPKYPCVLNIMKFG